MEVKINWILYAAGLLLMCERSRQISALSDEYDLMPYSLLDGNIPPDTSAKDGFSALNFSDTFSRIPVKDLDISGKTISSPFIINAVLKLYEAKNEYMFSIENKSSSIMSLNFAPADVNTIRITLSLENDVYDFAIEDIMKKWINMILFVDKNVSLYIDCRELEKYESSKKEIYFPEDFNMILGKSDVFISVQNTFQGAIQKIKLYNNADEETLNNICNGDSILPDFTVTPMDAEDYDDDPNQPENMVLLRGDGGDGLETPREPEPESSERGEPGRDGMPGEKGPRGEKGEKGQKGDAGIKGEPGASIPGPTGPQGPQGPLGPMGLQGKRGDVGECKCSESMVSNLLKEMPEMRGEPGEPGPQGVQGPRGTPGLTGKLGPQGDRGPEGLKGERGYDGSVGSPGSDGIPGTKGEPGKDGVTGERGLPGPVGPPGPPGSGYMETEEEKKARQVFIPGTKGDQGPIGPPGPPGPEGKKGETGAKGEQGLRGKQGDQGQRGAEGPRGEKGTRGEAGEDGLPGSPGRHGKHGERGDKGDRGDKGAPGLAGTPASITELLDPDMDPIDNKLIVEKLRGYKGDKGEMGEKGIKGDAGKDGSPGEPGKDGNDGPTGPRGEAGPRGEIGPMGHRGYKGDQGEPGPPGEIPAAVIANLSDGNVKSLPGPTGPRGPPGSKGQRGARGPTGYKGIKGDRGNPGPMGPIGPAGYNGSIGLKGDKGECAIPSDYGQLKGDKGDRGDPGKPGDTGRPGPAGQCSQSCKVPIIGPPGPPGPPGSPGLSITGPKGEPGGFVSQSTISEFTGSWPSHTDPNDIHGNSLFDDDDDVYTANTVIYRTTTALIKRTSTTRPGTLAYVLQEKILLVRVDSGWQHVEMGPMFHTKREVRPPQPHPPYPSSQFYPSPTTPRPTTASAPRQGGLQPRHYIRLAALNDPHTGKVHTPTRSGHSAADYECNQQSLGYGYGGNFRAFLTNRVSNAISMVERKERHLPVRNLKGEILFESWNSIFNGSSAKFVQSPVNIYSFDGRSVVIDPHWPHKSIWHGSNARGVRMPEYYCKEWDSESPNRIGMASSLDNEKMLNQDKFTCDNKLIVLCIEVSAAEPRRIRHHPRHYINNFPYNYGRGKT